MTDTRDQKMEINVTYFEGDCDDCGFYDGAHGSVELNGETVLDLGYDGHLGGGNWRGDMSTVYIWCLALLGIETHYYVDGALEQTLAYFERICGEWEPVDILKKPSKVLELWVKNSAETELDDYFELKVVFDNSTKIYTQKLDDEGNTLPGFWNGNVEEVLLNILAQVCNLQVDIVQETPDYLE